MGKSSQELDKGLKRYTIEQRKKRNIVELFVQVQQIRAGQPRGHKGNTKKPWKINNEKGENNLKSEIIFNDQDHNVSRVI